MPHAETWVRVNVPVDVGIAPLVAALSKIPTLETIESCEGNPGPAFVFFRFGDWRQSGAFLFDELRVELTDELRSNVSLTLRSLDGDLAMAEMTFDPQAADGLTACVRQAAARLATVSSSIPVASDAHGQAVA